MTTLWIGFLLSIVAPAVADARTELHGDSGERQLQRRAGRIVLDVNKEEPPGAALLLNDECSVRISTGS